MWAGGKETFRDSTAPWGHNSREPFPLLGLTRGKARERWPEPKEGGSTDLGQEPRSLVETHDPPRRQDRKEMENKSSDPSLLLPFDLLVVPPIG